MASYRLTHRFLRRLWIAVIATLLAFVVGVLSSLNLYLLEDSSALTRAAYSASPLLRFSYDGVYLTAFVSGLAICAMIGYFITRSNLAVAVALSIVALMVVLGGFGGLLVRSPVTFLAFLLTFIVLALICLWAGRVIAARAVEHSDERVVPIIGACISAGFALLINLAALVVHTIILNPVSHALFMQGQVAGTQFSSLLIAMGLELVAMAIYLISMGFVVHSPAQAG